MYDHARIALIIVARKMSSHCCVIIMFDVINITLESVNDSIPCLSYIIDMATLAFQAIYEIVALAGAFSDGIVDCVVIKVGYFP